MYRLSARMLQRLRGDLVRYHELFSGGRCSGWELEELVVAAIRSDNQAQHHVRWQEAGHDDLADIVVRDNGAEYPVQIKSGKVQAGRLVLSGHRMSRFDGDFDDMTAYLNAPRASILAVPYRRVDDENGRTHIYRVCYVPKSALTGLAADGWTKHGAQWRQISSHDVECSLTPKMSWQIWWKIPMRLVELGEEFAIG